MANTKAAIKEIRSSERRRKVNQIHRSRSRTYLKKARRLAEMSQFEDAEATAMAAISALDRAARQGVIHKNTAARRKSRLMKHLHQAKQQTT